MQTLHRLAKKDTNDQLGVIRSISEDEVFEKPVLYSNVCMNRIRDLRIFDLTKPRRASNRRHKIETRPYLTDRLRKLFFTSFDFLGTLYRRQKMRVQKNKILKKHRCKTDRRFHSARNLKLRVQ